MFAALINDLVTDHRVVTYDLRGCGQSTREGPYDVATDTADLAALIDEHWRAGSRDRDGRRDQPGGEGGRRATRARQRDRHARRKSRRARGIRGVGQARRLAVGHRGAVGNDRDRLQGRASHDHRGRQRSTERRRGTRARRPVVEYCAQDVGAARLRAWIDDDAREAATATGDRLWILSNSQEENPWFTAPALDRTRELLPEAHIEEIHGGPVSRPELTAAIIRRVTASAGSRV